MNGTLGYYLQRLKPLFQLYVMLELALRLVLTAHEWANLGGGIAAALRSLLTGFVFDIGVFAYFAIPVAAYLLILPSRLHGTRTDRRISAAFFFTLSYIFLFTKVSEWIFWDEFQTRFNFIAVDYLVYTQEVIGNIWESYPVVWLLSAIAVLSALSTSWLMRRIPHLQERAPRVRRRACATAAVIAAAVLSFCALQASYADFGDNRYWQEIARNGYFELFSAFRNNELSYDKFYARKDPATALAQTRAALGDAFTDGGLTHAVKGRGPEKHYNVMLVTVESLSGDYLGAFGNKKNLTPHLDALAKKSLFFTNLYATGTRTVYGLSAVTLSIPPVPGNSIVRKPDNGGLFSLGSVLNRKGYDSKFIYGGYGYFDNMNDFFAANGYKIVDRNMLAPEETHFANVWGVCDEDLFARAIKEADASYAAHKPFFNMLMTTSNHRPYTYPDNRIDLPSGKSGRAGGVKYTDYAISQLLQGAAKKPWFNNTIFVIIADHTASSAGKTTLDPKKYHIPLIIYAPGIVKPQRVEKLASQIDLAPTLLGLMDMSYKSRFYGVDLMQSTPARAYISTYQKLGYMTKDALAILEPIRKAVFFKRDGDAVTQQDSVDAGFVDKTTALYQTASRWRELNRDVK